MTSALIISLPEAANAESAVVLTSPRGTFRIEERRRKGEGKMTDTWIITAWIVATADPAERLRLGEPYDDDSRRSFFISPDENWICATVHVHSKMQGVMLYRRKTGFQFELVTTDDIEDGVDHPHWVFRAPDHFGPQGNPLSDEIETTFVSVRNYFVAWSADSARLLVEKRLQEHDSKAPEDVWYLHYFYYNLRRGRLEHTNYIRTLNRTFRDDDAIRNYVVPAFAEPLDPLPPEKQIRGRYEAADRRLNAIYKTVMERDKSERGNEIRKYQRAWLKLRDAGSEEFAATGPKSERPSRKLQYLADATESRVRELENHLNSLQ